MATRTDVAPAAWAFCKSSTVPIPGSRRTVKLAFSTKDQATTYAKKNNIDYYIVEPQKRKIIKKSYADNFLKNN